MQKNRLKKIQLLFLIKIINKLGLERNNFNLIKTIHKKSAANIMLNGKGLKVLRLGKRQGCPLLPLSFDITLEFLARAITQEK